MEKRYWANVSEVFFQSRVAARSFLINRKREVGLRRTVEAAHRQPADNHRTRTTFLEAPFDAVLH